VVAAPSVVTSLATQVTVTVRVTDASGADVAGALVTAAGASAVTGADGTARFALAAASLPRSGNSLVLLVAAASPDPSQAAIAAAESIQVPLALPPPPPPPKPAAAKPFASGAVGYDVSWPNCTRALPSDAGFLVVGVNGGQPFTRNPCFLREVGRAAAAAVPVSVYLNTAYSGRFLSRISPSCRSSVSLLDLAAAERRAAALGCSEAAAAVAFVSGRLQPTLWWLDVEPSNPWSSRPSLNAALIGGMITFLQGLQPRPTIG